MYRDLMANLSVLSVELVPIHNRLVELRRDLSFLSGDMKPDRTKFKAIIEELRKIDS